MPALANYTFNVGVVNSTYFLVEKLVDGKLIGVSGPYFVILQTLATVLGFKYRLIMAEAGLSTEWNLENNNSSINGMFIRNEIDFGAYFFGINYERHKYVSFSPFFFRTSLTYLTKKTPVLHVKLENIFIDPFQYSLWHAMVLILLIFPCFLRAIRYLKYRSKMKSWAEYWEIANLVMGNNSLDITRRDALTFLTITPFIILIGCTLAIYGSTISASVTSKESTTPINTIKELIHAVRYRNFKIGIPPIDKGKKKALKKSSTNKVSRTLEPLFKNPLETYFYNESEAWEAIHNSNFVYITSMIKFLLYTNTEKYSLNEIHEPKEPLIEANVAMPYTQSFTHQAIFTETLLRIISSGIIDKLTGLKKVEVTELKTNDLVFIDMIDLNIVFSTLLFMHLFAGFVLMVEILIKYRFYI